MAKAEFVTSKHQKRFGEAREFLTIDEQKSCSSISEAILKCYTKHPDASYSEIAEYLGKRPQHVRNVIVQNAMKKKK